ALASRDGDALRRIIGERNAQYGPWGFKRPSLHHDLPTEQLTLFDRLRVIVTVRDPVAMAVRVALSEYREPMRALSEAADNQVALLRYVAALRCPSLLLSYEKMLTFPEASVEVLLRFCGVPSSENLLVRLVALIQPNRPAYL